MAMHATTDPPSPFHSQISLPYTLQLHLLINIVGLAEEGLCGMCLDDLQ